MKEHPAVSRNYGSGNLSVLDVCSYFHLGIFILGWLGADVPAGMWHPLEGEGAQGRELLLFWVFWEESDLSQLSEIELVLLSFQLSPCSSSRDPSLGWKHWWSLELAVPRGMSQFLVLSHQNGPKTQLKWHFSLYFCFKWHWASKKQNQSHDFKNSSC